tara:strand:+ start:602 stop:775 length:174 start_codon:yes stop_codon:yes gene_type:complete
MRAALCMALRMALRACSSEERKAHMASSVIAALWPTQQTRGSTSSGSVAIEMEAKPC